MSSKQSRHSPSPTSPAPQHTSKLPKFLSKNRDRSKSLSDPSGGGSTSSLVSGTSSVSGSPEIPSALPPKQKKGSKFLGIGKDRDKEDKSRRSSEIHQPHYHQREDSVLSSRYIGGGGATAAPAEINEAPVIVEPSSPSSWGLPRPRNSRSSSERPLSTASDINVISSSNHSLYSSTSSSTSSSTPKFGERLSGWLSSTFTGTPSNDLSIQNILAQATQSPNKSKANPFHGLAKHGRTAMRYILDSDATPDKCPDPIWILGVQHPGWEPNQYQQQLQQLQLQQLQYQQVQVHIPQPPPPPSAFPHGTLSRRRGSIGAPSLRSSMSSSASTRSDLGSSQTSLTASTTTAIPGSYPGGGMGTLSRGSAPPSAYPLSPSASAPGASSSASSLSLSNMPASAPMSPVSSVGSPASATGNKDPSANWPPVFYADFTTRIWLTYRSQFPPIRDTSLNELPDDPMDERLKAGVPGSVVSTPVAKRGPWAWGGEKGWTSDSGWGCMLRTGQSLLANTLVHVHLGRDWRRPPYPIQTADYATYVQIVSWFLDSPSPEAPFSVHRMALAGKELGKDVGQWFGPSTAAGAIQRLVNSFPECGLGVAVAVDGTLYQSDVFAASHGTTNLARSPRRHGKSSWGHKPVLLLLGIRLGLDGVNPIYYSTIKSIYTLPQSVGIAGGRPSSSYYFVGSQADNLFYLDPHHARATVPLRPAPQVNHSAGAGSNVPVIQQVASMVPIVQQVQQQNGGGGGSLSSSHGHSQSPSQYSHSQHGQYYSSSSQSHGPSQYSTMRSKREGTPESDREWGRMSVGKGRPPSSASSSASASYRRSPSPPSNSPPSAYSIHQSLALHHQQHPSASSGSGSSSHHHHSQSYPSGSASGFAQPQPQPHAPTPQHYRSTTSPSSIRTGASSTFSYHAPLSPSPLQKEFSTGSTTTGESVAESFVTGTDGTSDSGVGVGGPAVNVHVRDADATPSAGGDVAAPSDGDSPSGKVDEDDLDVKDLIVNSNSSVSEKEESSGSSHQQHDHDVSGISGLPPQSAPLSTGTPPPAPSPLDILTDHYITSYSWPELKTFHCDKVRKMPLSGLDPSMLLGFLCKDEADWQDFRRRVAELPRQIFSIQDEPPSWPSDSDDNMGLESICEPDDDDDEDLLGDGGREDSLSGDDDADADDAELLAGVEDAVPRRRSRHERDVTATERSVSESGSGHGVEVLDDDEEEDAEDDEDGSEQFFDTQSGSASTSSHGHGDSEYQQLTGQQHTRTGSTTTDGDTSEDPLDPITPSPGAKFVIGPSPSTRGSQVMIQVQKSDSGSGVGGEPVKVGYEEEGDDIEDDWVDPSIPTPSSPSPTVPSEKEKTTKGKEREREAKEKERDLPRAPLLSAPPPPPMKKSKSGASTGSSGKKKKGSGSKSGKSSSSSSSSQIPVPVPIAKYPSRQSSRHHSQPQPQEHYPFPSEGDGDAEWEKDGEGWEGIRSTGSVGGHSTGPPGSGFGMVNGKRMHTAKARDGGRTQSGGVKGILPDEDAQGRLAVAAAADRE